MRTIVVPGTDVLTTGLGLGCAELYREPRAVRRRRILEVAHAAGIRHFDVAPMYGLGLAESELGRFARGRRDQVVIATKFGIDPSPVTRALARVQSPVRLLFNKFPSLRQQARSRVSGPASGRLGRVLYRAPGFDATTARTSLERSLRELGTDYLDLLLLHDPHPRAVRSDEVCAYLEAARTAGHLRAWGVAGELVPTGHVARALPVMAPVLQFRYDPLRPDAIAALSDLRSVRVMFGVLGQSIGAVVSHVESDHERQRAWQEAVGRDCTDPSVVADLLLREARHRNPDGIVLFGTIREDHVLAATRASDPRSATDPDLDAFRGLLDADLRVRARDSEKIP